MQNSIQQNLSVKYCHVTGLEEPWPKLVQSRIDTKNLKVLFILLLFIKEDLPLWTFEQNVLKPQVPVLLTQKHLCSFLQQSHWSSCRQHGSYLKSHFFSFYPFSFCNFLKSFNCSLKATQMFFRLSISSF